MSGMSIGPVLSNPASNEALSTPLLPHFKTGAQGDHADMATGKSSADRPLHAPSWTGDLNHYQAQVMGAELAKIYGRKPATTGPRDAARAYAQARRRPQSIASRPRLRAVA